MGRIYSFKFRSANSVGFSEFSDLLRVGISDQILAPLNLNSDLELATATSLTMTWSAVPDGQLKTNGYSLEMILDDDNWVQVFDSVNNPDRLRATIFGLQTAKLYTFRVFAYDFNGPSQPSEIFKIYACGLPRYFSPPRYVWSTQTTITIEWDAPKINGGCPIFDFEVQRDNDGTGMTWTEVNPKGLYPREDPYV